MIVAAVIIAFTVGLILGYALMQIRAHRQLGDLRIELAGLKAKGEAQNAAREQMENTFKALAGDALRNNSQSFLELAGQNLGKFQTQAQGDLEKKQQAFAELVKPISDSLKKADEQIRTIEKERKEAYGNISRYLAGMAETQTQLQSETRHLVQALRRPEVRGQWGEMTLRRIVELAGMVNYCDFFEQETQDTDAGRLRPDMIVRMPDKRELAVDSKTPLDNYLSAVAASSDEERRQHLIKHAQTMRNRIHELASKAYWANLNSPDFVVLFVPGEQFLSAALDQDPQIQEDAFANKVVLAAPNSLMSLLKVTAYGWRQVALAENAEKIRTLGEDLYKRLATFAEHLGKLGRTLGQSVESYNRAVGSFEHQVLPGARRFPEMGIEEKKSLPELDQIELTARSTPGNDTPDRDPGAP